ncbi:unnamed protein product [Callosobruchus maculatus]|uniref:VWFC domain-containing protein n=1 Tax=Callosobruchus maculatus TaxID=64391 RepID=A0A653CPK1_CALMS|nr:unnamed protein product [Callosobruchus maculatus]
MDVVSIPPKHCLFYGQFYDHGEQVTIKKCVECQCDDGSMKCVRTDPETNCPRLTCPPEQQFSVPDHCCKFCPDIDECAMEGGEVGHHCHSNTVCVNTVGSYRCDCPEGYEQVDKFGCAEVDECAAGRHRCHENAECTNTDGSYRCRDSSTIQSPAQPRR